jgi:RTA1 like protein
MQKDIPWERYMWALYIASICILIRSIFRVVEYVMGEDGYLLSHEIFLYIFDATLMLLTMAIYNLLHPSKIIYKERRGRGRCLELQDSGYALDSQVQMEPKP